MILHLKKSGTLLYAIKIETVEKERRHISKKH